MSNELLMSAIGVGCVAAILYFVLFRNKPAVSYISPTTPTDHMTQALNSATEAVRMAQETGGKDEPAHVQEASFSLAMGAKKALEVVHTAAEAAKDHLEGKHGD
jgi:hypothetical protein